jgi:hypothetical protein
MFKIRFPFRLPSGQDLTEYGETLVVGRLGMSLAKESGYHCLNIEGFESEESAKDFYGKINSGLKYVTLNTGLSVLSEFELQNVKYTEDPEVARANLSKSFNMEIEEPVDALIDGARPAIYLSEKNIRKITGGDVTLTLSQSSENFLKLFAKTTEFKNSEKVENDEKFRSALELYSGHFLEVTPRAKFLTLVMALETIAMPTRRTDNVLQLIDKWKKEADEELHKLNKDGDDYLSLESLSRELLFRKEDSIRRRIKNYVFKIVDIGDSEIAFDLAKSALKVYDFRSALVHGQKIDKQELSNQLSKAKEIVLRVLIHRFENEVGIK